MKEFKAGYCLVSGVLALGLMSGCQALKPPQRPEGPNDKGLYSQ